MNPDFEALLEELNAADARYLVVGAYALALHSRPRECAFIGRDDLITNKRAVGRPRDLADLDDLGV